MGSGLLNPQGTVNAKEVARLRSFAKAQACGAGATELGLGPAELSAYMDANFERAAGQRRYIDRALMQGEWPVLLRVMGKQGPGGRYLSLQDVIDLFKNRSLPERMNKHLRAKK